LYKDSINLPVTKFDLRANSVKREPELQKFWEEQQVYLKLSESNPGTPYVLHDGPPYANGQLHIGHFLNKVLKDVINRYMMLKGRKVRFVPGWDCHGLPIELKVLQNIGEKERAELSAIKLRRKARDFALKTVDQQRNDFKRFGVWADWSEPYLTLSPEYEAAQLDVFGQMVLKGYIYRGKKPVHWSPSSKTALAEAELEYPEGHTSRSIYTAFPVTSVSEAASKTLEPFLKGLKVAIWTTTPWTIPANLAVAVNPELTYAVVENEGGDQSRGRFLILARDLVSNLATLLNTTLTVKAELLGKDLENCKYKHPLYERESPVIIGGDYITTESGTGLVHTAPGHGQEDYQVGMKYGLELLSPVDDDGNFTKEAGDRFFGLNVLKEGNKEVIKALDEVSSLLKEEPYVHKYPYDWRSKQPTIFRATEQWFASVEGFRDLALKAIDTVEWIPAAGQNRITAMTESRSDWCISRQRTWGVPIPVFYDVETGEPLLTEETIEHVKNIVAKHERGSDVWWEKEVEELLPEKYRNNGKTFRKGTDTMDVWFDSGSSWAAVVEQRKLGGTEGSKTGTTLVDLYLEGSDQHRGWFQSSLLTSVATTGKAPYKTVLTHGFVMDETGRKMSKSLGNTVDPMEVINGGKNQKEKPPYGADVLRLWVASVDYSSDVLIGPRILQQLAEVYRKVRGTARFLLGNLYDYDPEKDAVPYDQLPAMDRYMLHLSKSLFSEIDAAYSTYRFSDVYQMLQRFVVVDISSFYADVAKDRLYISSLTDPRRRSCQTVMHYLIENLSRAVAPIMPHLAEDIWQYVPYKPSHASVFESGWLDLNSKYDAPHMQEAWDTLRAVRSHVNSVLEKARAAKLIGSSLEAKLLLHVEGDDDVKALLRSFISSTNVVDELRYVFLTSEVELVDSLSALEGIEFKATDAGVTAAVLRADGSKCDRCWNYSLKVGSSPHHPLLCERCLTAIGSS